MIFSHHSIAVLLLIGAAATTTTTAFVPMTRAVVTTTRRSSAPHRCPSMTISSSSSHQVHEEAIARIQEEYRKLQDRLYGDYMMNDIDQLDPLEVAEMMLEKATDATAFQRYKQQEVIEEAHEALVKAKKHIQEAREMYRQAHQDKVGAAEQAALVEGMDAAHEDLERLRDLSVVHAAEQLEHDAHDQEVDAQFEELEAEVKEEDAMTLLRELEQKQRDLKMALEELRDVKNEKAREEFVQRETEKHEEFLERAKMKLWIMIR